VNLNPQLPCHHFFTFLFRQNKCDKTHNQNTNNGNIISLKIHGCHRHEIITMIEEFSKQIINYKNEISEKMEKMHILIVNIHKLVTNAK